MATAVWQLAVCFRLAFQPFDLSTLRPFDLSTFRPFDHIPPLEPRNLFRDYRAANIPLTLREQLELHNQGCKTGSGITHTSENRSAEAWSKKLL